MKCLFYERSGWIKNIYENPTLEQRKEIKEVNASLLRKIPNTYVKFDFMPCVGMYIDLEQFEENFKLTDKEAKLITIDPIHALVDIEMRPDCLALIFDWDD